MFHREVIRKILQHADEHREVEELNEDIIQQPERVYAGALRKLAKKQKRGEEGDDEEEEDDDADEKKRRIGLIDDQAMLDSGVESKDYGSGHEVIAERQMKEEYSGVSESEEEVEGTSNCDAPFNRKKASNEEGRSSSRRMIRRNKSIHSNAEALREANSPESQCKYDKWMKRRGCEPGWQRELLINEKLKRNCREERVIGDESSSEWTGVEGVESDDVVDISRDRSASCQKCGKVVAGYVWCNHEFIPDTCGQIYCLKCVGRSAVPLEG